MIAPDGSPVEVFDLLPPGRGPELVCAAARPGASLLELGCGAGRMTRIFAAAGHRVVAVDVSPAMLARVATIPGVRCVLADVTGLDLGQRFDVVVLASYLINHPTAGADFLATCARHVRPDGSVIVQRYDPLWASDGAPDSVSEGNVTIAVTTLIPTPTGFNAGIEYRIGERCWAQAVEAAILDDDDVGRLAASVGLLVEDWLDEYRTWARLVPVR